MNLVNLNPKRLIAALIALSFVTGCGATTREAVPTDANAVGESLDEWREAAGDAGQASVPAEAPAFGDSLADLRERQENAPPPTAPPGYELFDWDDLVSAESSTEEIDNEYLARLDSLQDGDPEADSIYEEWQAATDEMGEIIRPELDGKQIHMAGFITPLDYEAEVITEFLFVPYFGACVHVPPPPVNQTIFVRLDADQALSIEDTWGAVWVTGQLTAASETTDLATAGYTISEARTEVAEDYY